MNIFYETLWFLLFGPGLSKVQRVINMTLKYTSMAYYISGSLDFYLIHWNSWNVQDFELPK